jgi:hypothetical protein
VTVRTSAQQFRCWRERYYVQTLLSSILMGSADAVHDETRTDAECIHIIQSLPIHLDRVASIPSVFSWAGCGPSIAEIAGASHRLAETICEH